MRRRLRKKKHLGEFKVLGFGLRANFRSGITGDEIEAFVDRLIDVVEARGICFGGGPGRGELFQAHVGRLGRGSTTEEDRRALGEYLAGDQAIAKHEIGPLRDAYYGDQDW